MNIGGIEPSVVGDGWFVIDGSGSFSLDKSVWAYVWLVGGGCDGADGYYDENGKTVHGGAGGDGGYIYKFGKIALFKNNEYTVKIAEPNEKDGTYILIGQKKYSCADTGRSACRGGAGSVISSRKIAESPQNGLTGVLTPVGYVGSSGGGGCAVYKDFVSAFGSGGAGAGSGRTVCPAGLSDDAYDNVFGQINAMNYGGGGGGNTFCYNCGNISDIGLKSKGEGGCIIIAYEPYDEKFPDLTVRYWNRKTARERVGDTAETSDALQSRYSAALGLNGELKKRLWELQKTVGDRDG